MKKKQLDRIRRAYDMTVRQHAEGMDPLAGVPEEFRHSAGFEALMLEAGPDITGSNAPGTKEFLLPRAGMKLLDIGCCANLANYRFDRWPALYYGVDISPALIQAMRNFAARENISIGGLEIAEAAALPFADGFFDIAMAVGVFEYLDLVDTGDALAELSRVLKAGARVVIDVPNANHPRAGTMFKLEEYLGRPHVEKSRFAFEEALTRHFTIDKANDQHVMLAYFLRRK